MIRPGDCADTLRSLGRYLELVSAADTTIVIDARRVGVSWQARGGRNERRLSEEDIETLRSSARLFRGTGSASALFGTAEFLRAIGRDLDDKGATPVAISETVDGFWATWNQDGVEEQGAYTYADLVARAQVFHRPHRALAPIS
jgi:hypothetical protein